MARLLRDARDLTLPDYDGETVTCRIAVHTSKGAALDDWKIHRVRGSCKYSWEDCINAPIRK